MGRRRRQNYDLPVKKRRVWTVLCLILIWSAAIAFRIGIDIYFPMNHEELIKKYVREFSLKDYGLDEYHIAAVICTESRFDEKAESRKGAVGLMQVLPTTGEWAAEKIGMDDYTKDRLWEPAVNIRIGCWYLSYLCNMFDGDLRKVFAAYNAGPGNVKEWIEDGKLVNIGHVETENYLVRVEKRYEFYKSIYDVF